MKTREIAVKYALFLFYSFQSDKRLVEAIYSLREGGEILGLRKGESAEVIKRKLGKPSYAEG